MGVYSIHKKVVLNDVEEITIDEEKILVRGTDKIIKEVDKSSFGGNPTFQEVVNNSTDSSDNIAFLEAATEEDIRGIGMKYTEGENEFQSEMKYIGFDASAIHNVGSADEEGEFYLGAYGESINLSKFSLDGATTEFLRFFRNHILLENVDGGIATYLKLLYPSIRGDNTLARTLATIEDINLQEVLEGGDTATFNDGNQTVQFFTVDDPFLVDIITKDDDGNQTELYLDPTRVNIANESPTDNGNFDISEGLISFTQQNSGSGATTKVSFEDPIALMTGAVIKFPAPPIGEYVVALTSDVDYNVITKAELDTLIAENKIKIGKKYKVTGVHENWCNIYVEGIATNAITSSGTGEFLNPDYSSFSTWYNTVTGPFTNIVGTFVADEIVTADNGATARFITIDFLKYISGDWTAATSITGGTSLATADVSFTSNPDPYSIDDIAIWGGMHWKNLTGNGGDFIDQFTLDSNWEIDTSSMIAAYDKIIYSYSDDLIIYREDVFFNKIGGYGLRGFRWGDGNFNTNIINAFEGEILNTSGFFSNLIIGYCGFRENFTTSIAIQNIVSASLNMVGITAYGGIIIQDVQINLISFSDMLIQDGVGMRLSNATGSSLGVSNVTNFKPLVFLTINGRLDLSSLDVGSYNVLFANYSKVVYNKPTSLTPVLVYINDLNVQIIADITT
jgi:hypothetical protein